jgi:hypothetical protein
MPLNRRTFLQSALVLFGVALTPRRQIEPPPTLYSDSEGNTITTELSDNTLATGVEYAA